jgi:hypothetical protein
MNEQSDLFNGAPEDGPSLRDAGMAKSLTHANSVHTDWGRKAYGIMIHYLWITSRGVGTFMTEDLRAYARGRISKPPDDRAWGGIIMRAVREGLIVRHGYARHKDPSRHAGPSTVWRVK